MTVVHPEGAWVVRGYQPGDERAIIALFERVYGRVISEAHWRWKLKTLPSPVENVWLAFHDDQLIFHYAGIPTVYQALDDERSVMVGVDTMTAPEFQRRGLLTQVGRQVYDRWRAAGVAFVLGLPNERWGSRAGALGWVELFTLQWLVHPLRLEAVVGRVARERLSAPAWFVRLSKRMNAQRAHPRSSGAYAPVSRLWNAYWDRSVSSDARDAGVQVRAVTRAGPEFDQLWQVCRSEAALSVVRDSAWVNWRYLSAPSLPYHVLLAERAEQAVGYLAYRVQDEGGRKVGAIAELFTKQADAGARGALLRHALEQFQAAGVEQAVTLAVPGTAAWRAWRRAGFFGGRSFSVQIVPLDENLPMAVLRDPRQWRMSGGDFDII
ncbi:MAG: GNAT family N-acetyltransferase [Chloroflexi bacterium]|nr:GNAT family N-acetyltransferase [Chloroflexota bacterium]